MPRCVQPHRGVVQVRVFQKRKVEPGGVADVAEDAVVRVALDEPRGVAVTNVAFDGKTLTP